MSVVGDSEFIIRSSEDHDVERSGVISMNPDDPSLPEVVSDSELVADHVQVQPQSTTSESSSHTTWALHNETRNATFKLWYTVRWSIFGFLSPS